MSAPASPSLKKRNATFHAFHVSTAQDANQIPISEIIWNTLTNSAVYDENGISKLTNQHLGTGFKVEIRDFKIEDGLAFGCVARCREDSPPVRRPDGSEILRPLQNGHTLLEKNYFLYSKEDQVLIWQFNLSGNHYSAFSGLLNSLSGGRRAFICMPNVNRKEMNFDSVEIEYVDFSISMPQSKKDQRRLIDEDPTSWGGLNPFRLMNEMDTQRFSGKFTAKRTKTFGERAINFFTGLSSQSTLRRLKVKIEDCAEPIDVLASRFKATQPINYHQGQHLDSTSMFTALRDVWDKYQQQASAHS